MLYSQIAMLTGLKERFSNKPLVSHQDVGL